MTSYGVPALDKALDILELLAAQSGGIGQAQLADALGRSVGEIFRVLQTLERRGFITRDAASGLYLLSTRMLELANLHPPLRGLVQLALGPMQRLAAAVRQSCNLSILEGATVRVIAQVESPADFGFRVRVGAGFPSESTVSGTALLAFAAPDSRAAALAELARRGLEPDARAALNDRLDAAVRNGWVEDTDPRQAAILDLAHPVYGRDGHAVAALTVPYVATSYSASEAATVRDMAAATARELSRLVQGA
ncbi:IclR family transcriptional regulator [Cryobacterium tepidiphilum]|uniref:IclR family transcriptional regulator n=1 Tax=Cryobacterium tepidiphilum TaxID=2486026 RepID=A0A3M8KT23_9MICO|nr:IclR family transcriptional regulator [Cryobacterium tepidiphilum]RNE56373.1 IclR family transcriptional regulator [Cryobacterium tepidiphilum]